MFTVIGNMIACVFWGVLISSILTGLLFYLPKAIHMRFGYTPPYILLLIIFFLFSTFQVTLLTGGFKAKRYIKTAENLVVSVLAETGYSQENLPPDEFGTLTGKLKEALPIPEASLHDAIGKLKQSGKQPASPDLLAQGLGKTIRTEINLYIWRRSGWIIAGFLLSAFLLASNAQKQDRRKNTRKRNYSDLTY